MKVKLLTIMAGPKGTNHPGDIIEVDEETGNLLIKALSAVPFVKEKVEEVKVKPEKTEIETAEDEHTEKETAELRKPRGKRG